MCGGGQCGPLIALLHIQDKMSRVIREDLNRRPPGPEPESKAY